MGKRFELTNATHINEVTVGGNDKLQGALEFFKSSTYDFVLRKIKKTDKDRLEELFKLELLDIYTIVLNTKPIKEEDLMKIVLGTLHKEDYITLDRNINQLILSNYRLRKEDIFNDENDEDTTINIHDI